MNLPEYIQAIQLHLIATHQQVLQWFTFSEAVRNYKPKDGGWTINEILEHTALTSHFLLILIDKGVEKAIKNVNNLSLETEIASEQYAINKIDSIGMHKSFDWIRPEHMEPTGSKSEFEIRNDLVDQLKRCLNYLEILKDGKGLLYKTTMTVNGLGKLNVYEYILFLSKHAERHVQQMKENLGEFEETGRIADHL